MAVYGVVVFEDAEELDFVGPWEVFTAAASLSGGEDRVVMLGERVAPLKCAKGMTVVPQLSFEDAPKLDVVTVPGGEGRRLQQKNPAFLEWLRKAGEGCTWVTSVCTGAFLLADAGFARGKKVTTHWSRIDELKERGDCEVLERVRFVRDGNVVSAAGVSAGIDMALWIVGQMRSPAFARSVQKYIEYDPAPPYAFETQ
jgi:transcriptional regulator GlxA family with amidase domain